VYIYLQVHVHVNVQHEHKHEYEHVQITHVSPFANPYGEIGSGYPTNVFDGNRLLLPIIRQKMALSDVGCLLTA
jgi:hypothetical protein